MTKPKSKQSLINRVRAGQKPIIIFICGMPGTRKSSTAVMLGGWLKFGVVIGTDEIYDVMMMYDRRPIMMEKSHKVWKLFGELTDRNYQRGFLSQSKAISDGVRAVLRKTITLGENAIFEGVHLAPSLYRGIKGAKVFHFLLVAPGFQEHQQMLRQKFGRRHHRQEPWSDAKVQHLERTQSLLVRDARRASVKVIQSSTPAANCRAIIDHLGRNL